MKRRQVLVAAVATAGGIVAFQAIRPRPPMSEMIRVQLEIVPLAERMSASFARPGPPSIFGQHPGLLDPARVAANPILADATRCYARLRVVNRTGAPLPYPPRIERWLTDPEGRPLVYDNNSAAWNGLEMPPQPSRPPIQPAVETVLAVDLFGWPHTTLAGCGAGSYRAAVILDFGFGPVATNPVTVEITQADFDTWLRPYRLPEPVCPDERSPLPEFGPYLP